MEQGMELLRKYYVNHLSARVFSQLLITHPVWCDNSSRDMTKVNFIAPISHMLRRYEGRRCLSIPTERQPH